MKEYDFCLAWNWEYDVGFVNLLDATCRAHNLQLLQITPGNLAHISDALINRQIHFHAYLDRSSDDDARFLPIVEWAHRHAIFSINDHKHAHRCWNKAAMHEALFSILHTPYTIVLPSYNEQPVLSPVDLSPLGPSFSIKPAHGGGGAGVVVEAISFDQVLDTRQEYPNDKYLLQTRIVPVQLGRHNAWFRVLYSAGEIYPFWWDMNSHVYTPIMAAEISHYRLERLRVITHTIANVSKLKLFSTEIALNAEGNFLVVDYVNDPIDLRLQSKSYEGVPDEIVHFIAESLARLVVQYRTELHDVEISHACV